MRVDQPYMAIYKSVQMCYNQKKWKSIFTYTEGNPIKQNRSSSPYGIVLCWKTIVP